MKKKITSIVRPAGTYAALMMAAALLFSSCTKNELEDLQFANLSKNTSVADVKNDKLNTTTDIQPTPGIPTDAMISLSYGACMGSCPSYKVSLSQSGVVIYTGIRNVRVLGTVRYTISPDVAYQLGSMMEHGGFFNFQDHYALVPDAQQIQTTLFWNGKLKTVVDCGVNIPNDLQIMRQKIASALDVDRFISGSSDNDAANITN
jgi:hypothetical protein